MGIRDYVEANEKTHEMGKIIKYIFCEGKDSNQLIITFPAFAGSNQSPQYNYIRTLKNCNCNRLFILDDYGPRGSYLIGKSGDNSIEEAVISLIKDICEEYTIKMEDVITHGTSKGGYCALYYGIKYNFGYVIAGAPQTRLGDYLSYFPEISDYIAGGHEPKDISYLNSLVYNLIQDADEFPEIYIQVGKGDHHYQNHIIPFCKDLDKKKVNYHLELRNYSSHSLTGNYYIEYLLKTLNNIDGSIISPQTPEIECTSIKSSHGHLEISCTSHDNDLKYSWEVYILRELVAKIDYQDDPSFRYPVNVPGKYHAKLHVKNNLSSSSSLTDEIEVNNDETLQSIVELDKIKTRNFFEKKFFSFLSKIRSGPRKLSREKSNELGQPVHELQMEKTSSNSYKFSVNKTKDGELVAWYIMKNDQRIDTIWYQQEPCLIYTFKEPGNYQIKYFVKDENSKLMYSSEPIVLTKEDINGQPKI